MWDVEDISSYLRYIDNAAENPALRSSRGGRTLPRIQSEVQSTSKVPIGLPQKLYNLTWMSEQEKTRLHYVKEELSVSEEVFELLVLVTHHINVDL